MPFRTVYIAYAHTRILVILHIGYAAQHPLMTAHCSIGGSYGMLCFAQANYCPLPPHPPPRPFLCLLVLTWSHCLVSRGGALGDSDQGLEGALCPHSATGVPTTRGLQRVGLPAIRIT